MSYIQDSGDYSESSEQSFPSQVRRDRRRDRDLYDGGPSENTYQQSYYSYEKSESKTSYMDKRS